MSKLAVLLFAADDGASLTSDRPYACCEVLRKPLLSWALDACRALAPAGLWVVTGNAADRLPALGDEARALPTLNGEALSALSLEAGSLGVEQVLLLDAAYPLLTAQTLSAALHSHREGRRGCTLLRRDGSAEVTGVGWVSLEALSGAAPAANAAALLGSLSACAGEYLCADGAELSRAADRAGLSRLNALARERVLERLWAAGVDIPLTDGVIIGPDVVIGRDTTILPGCQLLGSTIIGAGCVIGPNTVIIDCAVGDDTVLDSSRLAQSRVGAGVRMGPYSQLRPGSIIDDGVKIGNFVEVKNSTVGKKTSLAHLTYIGDSDFGARVNVGCGVVTVNYDGKRKHRTTVRDDAFIGCNTNLVAPVTVGEGAYVAAASTITEDVEPDALAIGRVRALQKPGWAAQRRSTT